MENPFVGVLLDSTAIVLSNDVPGPVKMAARAAKWIFGDRIQICDGVDDDVEINAAISWLPAAGGKLVACGNLFRLSERAVIDRSMELEGMGWSTEFRAVAPLADTNDGLIYWAAGVSNVRISHLFVNADGLARYALGSEELAALAYNVTIDHVRAKDGTDDVISIGSTSGFRVTGNLVERTKGKAPGAQFSGIEIETGSENGVISGNTLDMSMSLEAAEYLIAIDFHPAPATRLKNIVVSDNIIHTNCTGILVDMADGAVVSNNIITDKYNIRESAIDISASTGVVVEGNVITLKSGAGSSRGMRIRSDDVIIQANHITTEDYSYGRSIWVDGARDGLTIGGNIIVNCRRGIEASTATNSAISNNRIYGSYFSGIAVGSYAQIIANSVIANPAYAITGGILVNAQDTVLISDNIVRACQTGIRLVGVLTDVKVEDNSVNDNTVKIRIDEAAGTFTIKGNVGFVTENNVLSPAFAIDGVAVVTVTIPHGLDITPAVEDCQLTVVEDTNVDDWGYEFVKVESVGAANVAAKVGVTNASATGGATAKLALRVNLT